ncbi:MAG: hypothetical protein ACRBB0_04260 [Pelagimonas sp.]|uniref:hypothetical protein n=1 Tax=Pelagimonas sp. TaxID=2073170 RepID=UPI003D6C0310
MGLRSLALIVLAALSLAGCATDKGFPDASPEQASKAAYVHNGPPALTLYTMISNSSGSGAHTSLMINGNQRVVFDPAGSVRMAHMPEINDVLYGITPRIKDFYERAHARNTYHVRIQRIEVSAEVAQKAIRLAQAAGPVPSAQCAASTARILSQLPGFESIKGTWFPNNLADQLATIPGVSERILRENDADDKAIAIREFEEELAQEGQ